MGYFGENIFCVFFWIKKWTKRAGSQWNSVESGWNTSGRPVGAIWTEIAPVEPSGVINSPKMRAIQTTMALAGLTSMSPMGIKMNSISPWAWKTPMSSSTYSIIHPCVKLTWGATSRDCNRCQCAVQRLMLAVIQGLGKDQSTISQCDKRSFVFVFSPYSPGVVWDKTQSFEIVFEQNLPITPSWKAQVIHVDCDFER